MILPPCASTMPFTRQAQTRAAAFEFGAPAGMARDIRLAVELIEEVRDILWRDANPGVDNAHFDETFHVGRRLQQIERDGDSNRRRACI